MSLYSKIQVAIDDGPRRPMHLLAAKGKDDISDLLYMDALCSIRPGSMGWELFTSDVGRKVCKTCQRAWERMEKGERR